MRLNVIKIIGNLCKDGELKRIEKEGNPFSVLSLRVACNRRKNTDQTDFFDVTFFGTYAESVADFCKKGVPVFVSGRMESTQFEKDGENRISWSLKGTDLQILKFATN